MDSTQIKIAAEKVKAFADKKTVLTYIAGVATPPAIVYVFRKPIGGRMFPIFADEKWDERLNLLMSYRLDYRDLQDLKERRKREGTS